MSAVRDNDNEVIQFFLDLLQNKYGGKTDVGRLGSHWLEACRLAPQHQATSFKSWLQQHSSVFTLHGVTVTCTLFPLQVGTVAKPNGSAAAIVGTSRDLLVSRIIDKVSNSPATILLSQLAAELIQEHIAPEPKPKRWVLSLVEGESSRFEIFKQNGVHAVRLRSPEPLSPDTLSESKVVPPPLLAAALHPLSSLEPASVVPTLSSPRAQVGMQNSPLRSVAVLNLSDVAKCLQELFVQYPFGLFHEGIGYAFRKRYGSAINAKGFGFSSIRTLAEALPHVVRLVYVRDEVIYFPASVPNEVDCQAAQNEHLKELQMQVCLCLKKKPSVLPTTALLEMYKKKFNKDLGSPEAWGFSSLHDLLRHIRGVALGAETRVCLYPIFMLSSQIAGPETPDALKVKAEAKMESKEFGALMPNASAAPFYGKISTLTPTNSTHVTLLQTKEQIAQVKSHVLDVLQTTGFRCISADCEGVPDGQLCLVQLGLPNGHVILLDTVMLQQEAKDFLTCIFEDPSILKVMHDARRDSQSLLEEYGVRMCHIFDTQVAWGVICEWRDGPGDRNRQRISLNALLKKYQLPVNPLKDWSHQQVDNDPLFWRHRPLSSDQQAYAMDDVRPLVSLWTRMSADLRSAADHFAVRLSNQHVQQAMDLLTLGRTEECALRFDSNTFQPIYEPMKSVSSHASIPPLIQDEKYDQELTTVLELLPNAVYDGFQEAFKLHRETHQSRGSPAKVLEIVVDHGRPAIVRLDDDIEIDIPTAPTSDVIKEALQLLGGGSVFRSDNRMGIQGTLHRVSAIRDRQRQIVGLTYRIGRHIPSTTDPFLDLVAQVATANKSLLLLGPPGTGKTTLLRSITECLSNRFRKRVVVVDTSCEIAGDSAVPHSCIGRARRMAVPDRNLQHQVMVEAVQNHTPQVIVIDEIGTKAEVAAARTIAQRGTALVATAHGVSLASLIRNPELRPLIGGITAMTLGDSAAKHRLHSVASSASSVCAEDSNRLRSGKLVLERSAAPTFSLLIELRDRDRWVVHKDVASSVDSSLASAHVSCETRRLDLPTMQLLSCRAGPADTPLSLQDPEWLEDLRRSVTEVRASVSSDAY